MERDRVLFVKLSRGEQALMRRTAAATQQKIGEFVRSLMRDSAREVLGSEHTRKIFSETGTDDTWAPE